MPLYCVVKRRLKKTTVSTSPKTIARGEIRNQLLSKEYEGFKRNPDRYGV